MLTKWGLSCQRGARSYATQVIVIDTELPPGQVHRRIAQHHIKASGLFTIIYIHSFFGTVKK